jgi:ubiquitin carboxyl-terminal hydrolase 8
MSEAPNVDEPIQLEKWFQKDRGLCGLVNMGNTCFMNTALQCMLHTPLFVHLFMCNQYKEDYEYITQTASKERLADMIWLKRFNDLIRYMWHEGTTLKNNRAILPQNFLQDTFELARRHDLVEFSGFGQKDSIEFLLFVIDRIHQCLGVPTKMEIKGEPRTKTDKHAVDAYKEWIKFFQKEFSPILGIFYGQYYVKVETFDENDTCKETTRLYEPFNTIPIDIPIQFIQENRTPTIYDCLQRTFGTETITVSKTQYKKKRTTVWKLPKVMIFTLKRFSHNGKMTHHVDFSPDTPIDMGEFVYGYGKENSKFRLYAAIHHIGSMDSGHYYASIRHHGQWYCIDDTSIYPIDSSTVRKNVYALLYQHIV